MQIEQLPRCLLYRPVFGGGFGAPMGMVDTVTDRIAVGKQKKELLKMVNTGNETIDAQLKNYVDMVNQTATDLEDLVSAGRVNAQPSQSSNLQTTANIAPENRSGVVSGANDEIDVGDGNYQPFRYEVLDASTLSPTQQKDDNQFRDRDRIASQSQINNIARNLDPRKLASSPTMDIGAPLLALDGNTIIAGNGRTMAIRQAYQEDGADGYRQFLRDNADRFGIPPEQLDSVRNPVLVRRLTSPVDIAQVAINSNEQGGMRMSDLEQAKVDARRLPSMDSFIVGENGDINSLDNQSFVRQFILNQPENLRNELLDSKGNLSQTGVQRVRNAILYQAYGDSQVLSRLIENTDQGAKNVLNALVSLAPKVAQTQQDINVGTLSDVGISNDIIQAVEKYNQLNAQGYKISDYLAQNDFVGDLSPEAREILTIFDENRRSGKRIAQVLNAYFDQAQTQGNVSQANMFGDVVFDKLGSLQQAKTVDEDIRLSLNESADSDFAKAVVAISQGKNPESSVVQLGTTPDVLKMLGVSNANVVMGVRTLRKDMLNKHGVSAEAMKQLPAQMNNPVAVMRSQSNSSNPEAYLVLTELVEIENGKRKPIIAALSFEKNQKGDLELINVASAYGRRTNQINRDLANVLYWNKAKGEQLINNFSLLETAETASLRTLLSSATRLFDSNIKTETGLSQYQSAKNQPSSIDTQRFKQILTKAVGESAVKNIDIIQSGNKPDGVQQLITADVEGWFDPRTNKITLVADGIRAAPTMTREQRIAWVAWHELAHRGVNIRLKGEYKSIMHRADSHPLINAIANEIQQDRRGKQDKAAESRHVAVEEALAETFAAYQTGNFNELANRYGVDMSEQGFKAWLRQFADKVRALIDKLFGRETADKFSDTDLVNLMSEIKAGIHGESAVGNLSESDNLRFSRVQLRSKSESLEKLRQSETIRISGTEIEPSEDLRQYKRNALEYGKRLRGAYVNKDTGREISLGRNGVTEVLRHDYKDREHLQSIAAIPQVIENSIYIDTLPNNDLAKNPDIQEYEYYLAGLNIGGTDYTVRAVVGIATTGDKYYDHKLTQIEKGDLLEMTSRVSTAEISNQSPLSKIDDKRLLQILQDGKIENSNYRFSRSQSALDLSISGKAKKEQGFWGDVKSRNFESLKKRFNQLAGKIDENFADSLRPVNDWIDQMQFSEHTGKFNGRDHEKRRLKDAMYTAKGIRDALNSELEQGYLKPILNEITTITKKQRQDEKEIKALVST